MLVWILAIGKGDTFLDQLEYFSEVNFVANDVVNLVLNQGRNLVFFLQVVVAKIFVEPLVVVQIMIDVAYTFLRVSILAVKLSLFVFVEEIYHRRIYLQPIWPKNAGFHILILHLVQDFLDAATQVVLEHHVNSCLQLIHRLNQLEKVEVLLDLLASLHKYLFSVVFISLAAASKPLMQEEIVKLFSESEFELLDSNDVFILPRLGVVLEVQSSDHLGQ